MSVQASAWVIQHSKHKGANLLCLLMIANHAHADGTGAYPSIETLAAECRMSVRQVYRILPILEKSGELKIDRDAGPRGVSVYSLPVMMSGSRPDKMSRRTPLPDKMSPDISAPLPDIAMSPKPRTVIEKEIPPVAIATSPKGEARAIQPADGFAEFYADYPRHDNRQQAIRAWNKLTTGERQLAMDALPAWLVCEQWENPRYVPMAATFLNQRRFEDAPVAASRSSPNGRASPPMTWAQIKQANNDAAIDEVFGKLREQEANGRGTHRTGDQEIDRGIPGGDDPGEHRRLPHRIPER